MVAELFTGDQGACEVQLVGVGRRGRADFLKKRLGIGNAGFLRGLGGAVSGIEGGHPVGERFHVVAGSNEGAGGRFDPVGSVGGIAGGQDGSAIFEGDPKNSGLALRRQTELVANGRGTEVKR